MSYSIVAYFDEISDCKSLLIVCPGWDIYRRCL